MPTIAGTGIHSAEADNEKSNGLGWVSYPIFLSGFGKAAWVKIVTRILVTGASSVGRYEA